MSTANKDDKVIAILCADIHLSLNPPIARAGEKNWFDAMARPLQEIRDLATKHNAVVLCAGDIFDHWKAPPELINFAFDNLPTMYAIPGQHDLPFHSMEDLEKSAFSTLMRMGRIHLVSSLTPTVPAQMGVSRIYGFPWGATVKAPAESGKFPRIALVHDYVWVPGYGHPMADNQQLLDWKRYEGFSLVVTGDNHIPFEAYCSGGKGKLFNCGSIMRRKSNDEHRPRVGLLYEDGSMASHLLDTSQDIFCPVEAIEREMEEETFEKFLSGLKSLWASSMDFVEALTRVIESPDTPTSIRQCIVQALENVKKGK